jgi:hypothetical protein
MVMAPMWIVRPVHVLPVGSLTACTHVVCYSMHAKCVPSVDRVYASEADCVSGSLSGSVGTTVS